ncbi:MAG: hypothetical protein Q8M16_02020, partial [Pirellulaceae bacterium]|nr:hypothetical protein [Pirellulaceae bacterium]
RWSPGLTTTPAFLQPWGRHRVHLGGAQDSPLRPRFCNRGAATEFISVEPRIDHYDARSDHKRSGRGTDSFSKPTLTETATVYARTPARAVPKIKPDRPTWRRA